MSDDGLDDLALFVRIVEIGSLSAAARALGLPKSSLSRRLAALEQRLGVTLLERRTWGLEPTSDGRRLHERSAPALRDLARAQEELRQAHHGRGGLVRISAPPEIGRAFLMPALARVLCETPDLAVEVELGPRPVDLLAEGFDVVIRSGRVDDAALRVRLLFRIEGVLVASPRYLAERPAPAAPEDLAQHRCLRLDVASPRPGAWTLSHPRAGARVLSFPAALSVNDLDALRLAALEGLGIARLPALICAPDLAEGRLLRVLPEWSGDARPYYIAYAGGRLPRRLRALIDALLASAASMGATSEAR
jgi:DNA-binding transcriptional LysR family regulator